jgi:hypothetical protein
MLTFCVLFLELFAFIRSFVVPTTRHYDHYRANLLLQMVVACRWHRQKQASDSLLEQLELGFVGHGHSFVPGYATAHNFDRQ